MRCQVSHRTVLTARDDRLHGNSYFLYNILYLMLDNGGLEAAISYAALVSEYHYLITFRRQSLQLNRDLRV